MSNHQHNLPDDVLDRAVQLLRDMAVPQGPSEALVERTLARLESPERSPIPLLRTRLRPWAMFTRLAAAAGFLIGLCGIVFWLARPSPSFGQVVDRIRRVQAVTFKTTTTLTSADGKEERIEADVLIAEPARMRQTMLGNGATMVFDFKAGKALMLYPQRRQAVIGDMGSVPAGQRVPDILTDLKQVEGHEGKAVGEKQIGGHRARGFAIAKAPNPMTLWVDVQTRLPLEIEVSMQVGGTPRMRISMTDFRWDPPVDLSLLGLDPPADYEVRTMRLATGPLTEQDIITALRALTQINAPPLVSGVGMAPTLAQVLADVGSQVSDSPQWKQVQASLLQLMSIMGRGVAFGNPSTLPATRPVQ